MPARASRREAFAPLRPLPSTGSPCLGRAMVRPAARGSRGRPLLLLSFPIHLCYRCSCLVQGTLKPAVSQLCLARGTQPCWPHSPSLPPHHLNAAPIPRALLQKSKCYQRSSSPWEGGNEPGSEWTACHSLCYSAPLEQAAQSLIAEEKCPHKIAQNSWGVKLIPQAYSMLTSPHKQA